MINYRKKLIEVALPLEAINKAAAREKSIRHGHPSTLHLWWARRPLAACRAVLFASLVDDPDSDLMYRKPDGSVDEDRAGVKRAELFNLIEELVQWENSNNPTVINKARAEIARCIASRKIELGEFEKATIIFGKDKGKPHPAGPVSNQGVTAYEVLLMRARPEVVDAFLAEYAPPVLDPFCGGGSIPLEAQRLGLRAYGSDLNPVPVLITKALIEIPPKFAGKPPVNPKANKKMVWHGAEGLAEDVRYYGKWMRDEAEKRIGHLYPKVKITKEMATDRPDLEPYVGEELTVIAWLWARTVASPNPAVGGAQVPLVRSFCLSTKKNREAWIEPVVDKRRNEYGFDVKTRRSHPGGQAPEGLINRKGGRCLVSDSPLPLSHVRSEMKARRCGVRLLAIVAEGERERVYLPPDSSHESLAKAVVARWRPEGDISQNHRDFHPPGYGMTTFADIFTARQVTALSTLAELAVEVREVIRRDARATGSDEQAAIERVTALATYLAFAVDKCANYCSSLCAWHSSRDIIVSTFGRPGLPMIWDFAEVNPLSESTGNFNSGIEQAAKMLANVPAGVCGVVSQHDAATPRIDPRKPVFCTDPPYYDNIAYAELSDFFYVWLRRSIGDLYRELYRTMLTPKVEELIAAPYRFDWNREEACRFFEKGLGRVFTNMCASQHDEFPMSLFYAFKQAESESEGLDAEETARETIASTGWETMLEGLIQAGFAVNGTWPMRTELVGNLKRNLSVLASSIVIACRARSSEAPIATRREFLNAIKRELPEALKALQRGSIAPVDLAQAAIGPGMAVFTRYAKVMETDGSAMSVRTALGLINQALDEVLAEQEGEFDGDTRWALAWFEQFGMDEGPFGVAETLSKAKNTAVNGLVEAGVIKAKSGKVRLLKRDELPADWDPATDRRLTIWEITQHMIRTLDQQGESGAAVLMRKLGGAAEVARDLAYRLYTVCERRKWADEALAYNGLVIAWPELTKLAVAAPKTRKETQAEMFS